MKKLALALVLAAPLLVSQPPPPACPPNCPGIDPGGAGVIPNALVKIFLSHIRLFSPLFR